MKKKFATAHVLFLIVALVMTFALMGCQSEKVAGVQVFVSKGDSGVNDEEVVKELATDYVEKLSRVIYLYEDIDLQEGTVLTYGDAPEMQYVVEKSDYLKTRRVKEDHYRTDWEWKCSVESIEISEGRAKVTLYEGISFRYEDVDFDSAMGNEYTIECMQINGEWLVFSVEGGDTYSLNEVASFDYEKEMAALEAAA